MIRIQQQWFLPAACVLALALASGAGAMSLADLVGGMSFSAANGVGFSNFSVSAKGQGVEDLSAYTVTPTSEGFMLSGPPGFATKGKMTLEYDVSGLSTDGLVASALAVQTAAMKGIKSQVASTLIDPGIGKKGKKVGKLKGQNKAGKTDDVSDLDAVTRMELHVVEKIKLKGDVFDFPDGNLADHGFTPTTVIPEPVSALLLGGGLAGLGAMRRRVTRR